MDYNKPLKELKWISMDFDGVLANNTGHPDYLITTPIEGAKETLTELRKRGWRVIIYTARPYSDYENIERFLKDNGIPFKYIVCGKLLAAKYYDDRNVGFKEGQEGWDMLLEECQPIE